MGKTRAFKPSKTLFTEHQRTGIDFMYMNIVHGSISLHPPPISQKSKFWQGRFVLLFYSFVSYFKCFVPPPFPVIEKSCVRGWRNSTPPPCREFHIFWSETFVPCFYFLYPTLFHIQLREAWGNGPMEHFRAMYVFIITFFNHINFIYSRTFVR